MRLLSAGNHIHGFVHARSPLTAAEMVEDVLGRPHGFEAYRAYIAQQ